MSSTATATATPLHATDRRMVMGMALSPTRDCQRSLLLRLARVAAAFPDVDATVHLLPADAHRTPVHVQIDLGESRSAMRGDWVALRGLAMYEVLITQMADYLPRCVGPEVPQLAAATLSTGELVALAERQGAVIRPLGGRRDARVPVGARGDVAVGA